MKPKRFVGLATLTFSCESVGERPIVGHWPSGSRHYRVTLWRGEHGISAYYSPGPAIRNKPTLAVVLESWAFDASYLEDKEEFFQGWEGTPEQWEACQRTDALLRALLGENLYDILLHDVEW